MSVAHYPLWLDAWILGASQGHAQAASLLAQQVHAVDTGLVVLPIEQRSLPHPFFYNAFVVSARSPSFWEAPTPVPPTFLLEQFSLDSLRIAWAQAFPHVAVALCAQDRSRRLASDAERAQHVAAMVMLWAPPQMPRGGKDDRPNHFKNDIPDLNRDLTFCFADNQVSDAAREDPASMMSTGVWMMGGPVDEQITQWLQAQERASRLEGVWSTLAPEDPSAVERL